MQQLRHVLLNSKVGSSSVFPAHINWTGRIPLSDPHHNYITIPLTTQFREDFVILEA